METNQPARFIRSYVLAFGGMIGTATLSYQEMVSVFGEPNGSIDDDGKTSTCWFIRDTWTLKVFEVYDYKQTSKPAIIHLTSRASRNFGRCQCMIGTLVGLTAIAIRMHLLRFFQNVSVVPSMSRDVQFNDG